MDWGAFLTTGNGVPWWTPKTTPLSFVRKESVWTDRYVKRIETGISTKQPCMAFMCAHTSNVWYAPYGVMFGGGSEWGIEITRGESGTETSILCEIYLFTLVYPQPVPDWGIAVWDEAGKCVITSDTRPLSIEGELSSHSSKETVVQGKKGILMQKTGWILSKYDTPDDTRTRDNETSFSTAFDGHNTRLMARVADGETNWIVSERVWNLTSPYIDCTLYD
ncbi:hypothetical protein KKJ17_13850 [Xenorhabdus bovienii]|uniref:hypothetical protein n=1 Tax=Xenorhabdus bovienii TaxID=40576 RepID=UPI0023B20FFC|nr:hypothetical protein [Xenorhabdus bovienii]MDE9518785.1 hypothetical protein [Xenorhabdus bovienii]